MTAPRGSRDWMILTGFASGAAHDPALREAGYGSILRDFYNRALAGFVEGTVEHLPSLGEMSSLVSLANRQWYAEQALGNLLDQAAATGVDYQLGPRTRARDFDATPGAGSAYPAQVRIRFELTTTVGGEQLSRFVTYEPLIEGPGTTGELLDMISAAGQVLAEDYGEEFEEAGGRISITYA